MYKVAIWICELPARVSAAGSYVREVSTWQAAQDLEARVERACLRHGWTYRVMHWEVDGLGNQLDLCGEPVEDFAW